MKTSSLTLYSLALIAAGGLMAGCSSSSGSSGVTPGMFSSARTVSINGLLVPATHPNLNALHHYQSVTPDKHKKKKKTADQYLSSFDGSTILQFDYPKSDASIGTISGVTDPPVNAPTFSMVSANTTTGSARQAPTSLTSLRSAAPRRSRPSPNPPASRPAAPSTREPVTSRLQSLAPATL